MTDKAQALKEDVLRTCTSIWKHADDKKRTFIQNILVILLRQAKVVKWESTKSSNEYSLEIAHEVVGSHPEIPLGELVLKPKMKMVFHEEKSPETGSYRQEISFPDQGICHRIKFGWLSKDMALDRILVEEDQKHQLWCTIEGLGQKIVKPADLTLDFWNKIHWMSKT